MALFSPQDFMSAPDQDVFDQLNKDDLCSLASFLELSFKKSWRKIDIQKVIVKHLISVGHFDESSLASYSTVTDVEMRKLELQTQLEFKRLELHVAKEEREREREERE